jgi:membrane-bound lytic murein transglycosylase D
MSSCKRIVFLIFLLPAALAFTWPFSFKKIVPAAPADPSATQREITSNPAEAVNEQGDATPANESESQEATDESLSSSGTGAIESTNGDASDDDVDKNSDVTVEVDEEAPVNHQAMPEVKDNEQATAWVAPRYHEQSQALGYSGPETFAIPKGMEERVAFWLEIYTKYTTQEGVLHDSLYINNIYEPISFVEIESNPHLSESAKRRQKKALVKNAKNRIRQRLLRLEKIKDSSQLSGEDLRYWTMYEGVNGKGKFAQASRNGRLRFQLGQKDRFVEGIFASGRYLPAIEEIFREANLPLELTRLPFVESSFNIFAYSKVGASGIWQIMRYTARPYMKVSHQVDERNDPIKASKVAAKILTSNYRMLGSWPLALTGYNHGPSGVRRLVRNLGTEEITEIIDRARSRRFGFASENFYASFLAALEAEKNAEKYFGNVSISHILHSHTIKLEKRLKYATLLEWFDGDADMARLYNPHILLPVRKGSSPIPRGTTLRILKEKESVAMAYLNSNFQEPKDRGGNHKVRRGETLSTIARKYGVSQSALAQINNLRRRNFLRIGQVLLIPAPMR